MMEDTQFMDKWIPLMMQNVMNSLQLDSGNPTSMPMMNMSMNKAPVIPNGTGSAVQ